MKTVRGARQAGKTDPGQSRREMENHAGCKRLVFVGRRTLCLTDLENLIPRRR